jgi:predicted negative regulator of RcsB-dependent stress response
VLYQKGQYEQARQWLDKALEAGGKQNAAILEHYGDVLFRLNKVEDAVAYWQLALEAGGDSALLERKINARALYE